MGGWGWGSAGWGSAGGVNTAADSCWLIPALFKVAALQKKREDTSAVLRQRTELQIISWNHPEGTSVGTQTSESLARDILQSLSCTTERKLVSQDQSINQIDGWRLKKRSQGKCQLGKMMRFRSFWWWRPMHCKQKHVISAVDFKSHVLPPAALPRRHLNAPDSSLCSRTCLTQTSSCCVLPSWECPDPIVLTFSEVHVLKQLKRRTTPNTTTTTCYNPHQIKPSGTYDRTWFLSWP